MVNFVLTGPLKLILLAGGVDNAELPAAQKQGACLHEEKMLAVLMKEKCLVV